MMSSAVVQLWVLPSALLAVLATVVVKWRSILTPLGWYLRRRSKWGIKQLRDLVEEEEAQQREERKKTAQQDEEQARYTPDRPQGWDGSVGFFHPFWWDPSYVIDHHALY